MERMHRLSEFDQASPRTYTQIALAFPLAGSASASVIQEHLRASLDRVEREFPLLAGKVQLQKSRFGEEAFILPPSDHIPLVCQVGGTNYGDLADRGFPAQDFINPTLDLDTALTLDDGPIPVAHVRCNFIRDGLILILSLSHLVGDAYCLGLFAEAFSAATRGEHIEGEYSPVLQLPQDEDVSLETLLTLSRKCPEYNVVLYPNSAPSLPDTLPGGVAVEDIPKESKIFVIKIDELENLREQLRDVRGPMSRKPSRFACLAALTWAHVTKVRVESEEDLAPPSRNADIAKLFTPIEFRLRLHSDTERYFGNALITVPTQSSVDEISAASDVAGLAKVVAQIATTFLDVDERAVLRREAMFKRIGDYRRLVLNQDRRLPGQLQFNSWRYYGGNDVWRMPGMGTRKPDAVRRVQGGVSLGNALILPLSSESEFFEILVQLPQVSMAALLRADGWMRWIHRVIG